MDKRLFGEAIAHYASREPKCFLQLDGHYAPGGMSSDEDGDALTSQGTVELMRGATVRVLIPYDTNPKVAARQLKKIAKWLKRNPEMLGHAAPKSEALTDRSGIPF